MTDYVVALNEKELIFEVEKIVDKKFVDVSSPDIYPEYHESY